jgi:hypothetical protein
MGFLPKAAYIALAVGALRTPMPKDAKVTKYTDRKFQPDGVSK